MLEIYDLEVVDIQDVSNAIETDVFNQTNDSSNSSSVLNITVYDILELED